MIYELKIQVEVLPKEEQFFHETVRYRLLTNIGDQVVDVGGCTLFTPVNILSMPHGYFEETYTKVDK